VESIAEEEALARLTGSVVTDSGVMTHGTFVITHSIVVNITHGIIMAQRRRRVTIRSRNRVQPQGIPLTPFFVRGGDLEGGSAPS
jgi:hypothetical protein